MNCNPIREREDWFITDRKPTICPRCGKKEVRKAVLGYPTEEDFHNDNIYLIGCIPDFPIDRTWGCRQSDAPLKSVFLIAFSSLNISFHGKQIKVFS